ncbi:hypothetical protein PoB_002773800 [Plakobranchus ocellatus]|uniref:Uncharacterized protein n=1 Tax=Plakobranchus ocellatus TaxID=259542 RepID=A0AAV4A3I8_9GAST|nr:hypothetical protein PoB_002773800 [Plakobranchus ocellatus]
MIALLFLHFRADGLIFPMSHSISFTTNPSSLSGPENDSLHTDKQESLVANAWSLSEVHRLPTMQEEKSINYVDSVETVTPRDQELPPSTATVAGLTTDQWRIKLTGEVGEAKTGVSDASIRSKLDNEPKNPVSVSPGWSNISLRSSRSTQTHARDVAAAGQKKSSGSKRSHSAIKHRKNAEAHDVIDEGSAGTNVIDGEINVDETKGNEEIGVISPLVPVHDGQEKTKRLSRDAKQSLANESMTPDNNGSPESTLKKRKDSKKNARDFTDSNNVDSSKLDNTAAIDRMPSDVGQDFPRSSRPVPKTKDQWELFKEKRRERQAQFLKELSKHSQRSKFKATDGDVEVGQTESNKASVPDKSSQHRVTSEASGDRLGGGDRDKESQNLTDLMKKKMKNKKKEAGRKNCVPNLVALTSQGQKPIGPRGRAVFWRLALLVSAHTALWLPSVILAQLAEESSPFLLQPVQMVFLLLAWLRPLVSSSLLLRFTFKKQ